MHVPIYWITSEYRKTPYGPYGGEYIEHYKQLPLYYHGEITEQMIDVTLRDSPCYHVKIEPVTPDTFVRAEYGTLLFQSRTIGYLTFVPHVEENTIVCSAFHREVESFFTNGEYRDGEYVSYDSQRQEVTSQTVKLFELTFPLTRQPYRHEFM